MQCGLLGRKLGHSYSPQIHGYLGAYAYALYEKEPEDVEGFLREGDFQGLNVTIPYKQAVIPYLDELSPIASQLGAVNTIVRRSDGSLLGHNTDYFGFQYLLHASGLDVRGKKVLVLGTGGASKPVTAVLGKAGARVVSISRSGEDNYQNLHRHADAAVIVNTTPVGMYPGNGCSPVSLDCFPHLEGVLDIVFNPARTQLLLEAEKRELTAMGGLPMLVAQAKESSEWFTETTIPDEKIQEIYHALTTQMENIALIGMPGSGKSTIAALLGQALSRTVVDADQKILELAGKSIPEIFAQDGEDSFRSLETQALGDLGKASGIILATGGGCVTREENYPLLHQNSRIFWLQRDIELLPTDGRPLSQAGSLERMYQVRKPLYARFADHIIDNNGTPEETVAAILAALEERP